MVLHKHALMDFYFSDALVCINTVYKEKKEKQIKTLKINNRVLEYNM